MLDPDAIRRACAQVAAQARHVKLRPERVGAYGATLEAVPSHPAPAITLPAGASDEERAAFHLVCDAINFGSGWFPTLRKRDGLSGSLTVMSALRDFYAAGRGWDAAALSEVAAGDVADVLGQDRAHELMDLYARHLRELGERVSTHFGNTFVALARVPGLARELSAWPGFADVAHYGSLEVPFFKRAQLTAYDMACAGFTPPGSEGDLTMFADNLVPHVLRVDGLLELDHDLATAIAEGELLAPGSPAEVEIRACGLHCVELIAAARPELTAPGVDQALWHRGQAPRYKAVPRHRTRCEAY